MLFKLDALSPLMWFSDFCSCTTAFVLGGFDAGFYRRFVFQKSLLILLGLPYKPLMVIVMGKKNSYRKYLQDTLGGLIDKIDISDLRKEFLKNRWLDQVLWLEGRASKEQKMHYRLRLVTIIGGVLVPAMVGLNGFPGEERDNRFSAYLPWIALGISQAVAVTAAVEDFFGHGEKYLNYRNTAEGMKIEGWQYFQLAGPYRQFKTHGDAYTHFAGRVEQYIRKDVKGFIAQAEERIEESENQRRVLVHVAGRPIRLRSYLDDELIGVVDYAYEYYR